jgi:hypothetical protein
MIPKRMYYYYFAANEILFLSVICSIAILLYMVHLLLQIISRCHMENHNVYMQWLRWGGMASHFFLKSPETIPLPFNSHKLIPPPFLADLKSPHFFLADVKPLLALLLFCTNSNVNMQCIAIMKELHFTFSV